MGAYHRQEELDQNRHEVRHCYVIPQLYLKRKACRWAPHLWWLSVHVPRLFFSAQKTVHVSDGEICDHLISLKLGFFFFFNYCCLFFTCPLENGAPKTATLCPLLCCKVFRSLVLRRRNSGPLKAMFPKNINPILERFHQTKWRKVRECCAE